MKGGEEEEGEEEARPWHNPIPSRPTSCLGRDPPEPSEPCQRTTVSPGGSPVQIQDLDAWRHAELSRHASPTRPDSSNPHPHHHHHHPPAEISGMTDS